MVDKRVKLVSLGCSESASPALLRVAVCLWSSTSWRCPQLPASGAAGRPGSWKVDADATLEGSGTVCASLLRYTPHPFQPFPGTLPVQSHQQQLPPRVAEEAPEMEQVRLRVSEGFTVPGPDSTSCTCDRTPVEKTEPCELIPQPIHHLVVCRSVPRNTHAREWPAGEGIQVLVSCFHYQRIEYQRIENDAENYL